MDLPPVLLVDGHSMIFAWDALKVLHSRRSAAARQQLIDILSRLADQTGQHVVIVFDGKGAKPEIDPLENRIQVFYSRAGQSADAIIERLVAKYSATHRITVATDDHLERTTVSSFGGAWISSKELHAETLRAEADMQTRLQDLKRRNRRS